MAGWLVQPLLLNSFSFKPLYHILFSWLPFEMSFAFLWLLSLGKCHPDLNQPVPMDHRKKAEMRDGGGANYSGNGNIFSLIFLTFSVWYSKMTLTVWNLLSLWETPERNGFKKKDLFWFLVSEVLGNCFGLWQTKTSWRRAWQRKTIHLILAKKKMCNRAQNLAGPETLALLTPWCKSHSGCKTQHVDSTTCQN